MGNRFRKEMGDLTPLEKSIAELNCLLHPIILDENLRLIAGKRRVVACKNLGWDKIPATIVNISLLKTGELDENICRKNFTQSELARVQKYLKESFEKSTNQGKRNDLTSTNKLVQVNSTLGKVGKIFGESGEHVRRRLKIYDSIKNSPAKYHDLSVKLDDGNITIKTAHTLITTSERKFEKVKIPKGQWNVIEIDFPWGYQNQSLGHTGSAGAKTQYPTIQPKQILDTEVPKFQKIIAKDAVLFMWVTVPLLSEIIQLQILEKLGFQYKTMISWHKLIPKRIFGGKGLGYWFEGEMEHCMVGIKGDIRPFRCNLPNFIEAPITKHSEKPTLFKELFEKATKNIPNRKCFEGYSRRYRKGWSAFGNQLDPIKINSKTRHAR